MGFLWFIKRERVSQWPVLSAMLHTPPIKELALLAKYQKMVQAAKHQLALIAKKRAHHRRCTLSRFKIILAYILHADISSRARGLNFGLSLYLCACFVHASTGA